jgi:hypothetical protein
MIKFYDLQLGHLWLRLANRRSGVPRHSNAPERSNDIEEAPA